MIRLLTAALLTVSAPVWAAEDEDPDFTSAAVAGSFEVMPPNATGYPRAILLKMRERLGGTPPPDPTETAEPGDDGH